MLSAGVTILLIQSPRVPTNGDAGNSSENKRKRAKKTEVVSKKKEKKGRCNYRKTDKII